MCRRAEPLQETAKAQSLFIGLNPGDASRLGLVNGDRAMVMQGDANAEFDVRVSDRVPPGGVWLCSSTGAVQGLGSSVAPINVEVA